MTDYIKDLQGTGWRKADAEKMIVKIKTDTVLKSGILRWTMGNLVPQEIAEFAKHLGVAVDLKKHEAARAKNLDELVKRMKLNEANMSEEARAERDYEMRAAFGPGETVVNILTGKTYKT